MSFVVKVECGNCGDPFWCHDPEHVGRLAESLHEHWNEHHAGVNIHGPAVTVYEPRRTN